jgi:uncharacterized protein (DUF488 family)
MPLHTLGHSTRPLDELVALLRENGVTQLADVRTVPRSRHNPQYNADTLPGSLQAQGIGYTHMPELGGLRKARRDSINMGWRNASFRGYADYMQTPEFEQALTTLMQRAEQESLAVMCAEAVPWRCHRSLIADALSVRGVEVRHIMGPAKWQPHKLTGFAQVDGLKITYPFALEG